MIHNRLRGLLAGCLLAGLAAHPAHAQNKAEAGGTMMVVGGGILLVSVIVDIARVPNSALEYNAQRFGVVPIVDPLHRTAGLGISYALRPPARRAFQIMDDRKRPGAALAWSTVSTVAPALIGGAIIAAGGGNDNQTTLAVGATLVGTGLVIGPAVGHWYARSGRRSAPGLAIRIGAALLGGVGAALLAGEVD